MNPSHQEVLTLLGDLLRIPSPPGREERMAAYIQEQVTQLDFPVTVDPCGNVLVSLPGSNPDAPSSIFAAHMDEIGLVVTRIEPDGRLAVDRSGGLAPLKLGERPLLILGDEGTATGVISYGSGHSAPSAGNLPWENARIITGLTPEQLKDLGIRPGSSAVPLAQDRGPVVFGDPENPLVGAWTFDDRMGVAALLLVLRALKDGGRRPYRPTTVAFTVHEEGGAHGAKVLAHRLRPETFIAVDGCPILSGGSIVMDERPAVWSKDGKGNYDQRLVRAAARAARLAGTEIQTAVLGGGIYSDAMAVYDTGGASRVLTIGHARENSHGFEVVKLAVVENLVNTLLAFMEMPDWEGTPV